MHGKIDEPTFDKAKAARILLQDEDKDVMQDWEKSHFYQQQP